MRYTHDCTHCKSLGEHGDADLYFCDQHGAMPTVIARYGNSGSDYVSGLVLAGFDDDITEAKRRAQAEGLLPMDNAKT